jgi:ribosomal protein L11 methyltransferase
VKWAQIEIRCASTSVDAVSALLISLGCGGSAVREDGPAGAVASPSWATVVGYLPVDDRLESVLGELRERLGELPRFGLEVEDGLTLRTVQDQDWESAWKTFFKPLRVGRRFVIKPSWEEYSPRPEDVVLELDPGMAFGTGAHPTTQLCLEALEESVHPGERVLDFGTGSGILALAAARMGASVLALDIDPVAAAAAELNVTANHLREEVRVQGGGLEALAPGDCFDGIVANILAGVILDHAEDLAARCRPGGWLIASGIINHRADAVAAGLAEHGFSGQQVRHRGEWIAILARRRARE